MMSQDWQALGEAGLQFFGKVTASISHEIKNALAIINESAGLLDDLTLLAEKGVPLDPVRIKNHAGKIMKQIQRADGIVKVMNRFAHSVDEKVKNVDLYHVAEFVSVLSARLASMRGVDLAALRPEKPVTVQTNPFLLEHALWVCLDFAMEKAGKGQKVMLEVDEKEKRARVNFTGIGLFKRSPEAPFPGERETALMGALGAEIEVDEEKGEVVLSLPSGKTTS
jgi:C4-dicarboxylate-specific signal transduction histidine kinase